jgi:hypothetical protein
MPAKVAYARGSGGLCTRFWWWQVLETLRPDDERVLDLDHCLGKSPAMLVQEHLVRHYGATMPTVEVREATREQEEDGGEGGRSRRREVRGHEHSLTLGSKVFTAFDSVAKRAKQRARASSKTHTVARRLAFWPAGGPTFWCFWWARLRRLWECSR